MVDLNMRDMNTGLCYTQRHSMYPSRDFLLTLEMIVQRCDGVSSRLGANRMLTEANRVRPDNHKR